MGKCLSCLRIDPVPQQQQTQQDYRYQPSKLHLVHMRHCASGTTQVCEVSKDASESGSSLGHSESRSPIPAVDSQSNGSSRASTMPEKRSIYSRITPLAKSASNEIRKVSSKECSEVRLGALFDQYRDPSADAILSDGILRFCADLDVKPDDFRVLLLAWKLKAETMCRFSREEFFGGCRTLKADTVKGIQSKFNDLLIEVQNPDKFKDFYRFTFKFGLDSEAGQRILPVEMAIVLWKLVFSQREPLILPRWINFLEKHPNIRGISKDTWFMFLNFTETVADDLTVYDDTEAWPSLLDDFVEYENDQLNQNISKDQKETME